MYMYKYIIVTLIPISLQELSYFSLRAAAVEDSSPSFLRQSYKFNNNN